MQFCIYITYLCLHLLLALLQSGTHCSISVDPLSFSALSSVLWKLSCLTLPIVNVNTLPSLCHYAPLIHLRHTALYKCVFDLVWLWLFTSFWRICLQQEEKQQSKLWMSLVHKMAAKQIKITLHYHHHYSLSISAVSFTPPHMSQ